MRLTSTVSPSPTRPSFLSKQKQKDHPAKPFSNLSPTQEPPWRNASKSPNA